MVGTPGNLRVLFCCIVSTTVTLSGLSGGGVANWIQAVTGQGTGSGLGDDNSIWYGLITDTGTTLSLTYAGTIGSTSVRTTRLDFSSNRPANAISPGFQVDASGGVNQTSSVSTVQWPSLTSSGTPNSKLYVGMSREAGAPSGPGSDPGFTYEEDSNSNYKLWNTSVPANTTESPSIQQTSAPYDALAVIFSDPYITLPTRLPGQAVNRGASY